MGAGGSCGVAVPLGGFRASVRPGTAVFAGLSVFVGCVAVDWGWEVLLLQAVKRKTSAIIIFRVILIINELSTQNVYSLITTYQLLIFISPPPAGQIAPTICLRIPW